MATGSSKIVFRVVPILLLLGGSVLAQTASAPAPAAPAPLSVVAATQTYGIGRVPTAAELAASSITIYPDGTGLPVGSGDAKTGAQFFADNCAACHGAGAVGGISAAPNLLAPKGPDVDAWNRGASIPTMAPYATIVWDFIHRGMPLGNEGTLTADQVYSVTAYLLAINQIIPQDMVLNQDNLAKVTMPMKPNEWFPPPDSTVPVAGFQRLPGYPY